MRTTRERRQRTIMMDSGTSFSGRTPRTTTWPYPHARCIRRRLAHMFHSRIHHFRSTSCIQHTYVTRYNGTRVLAPSMLTTPCQFPNPHNSRSTTCLFVVRMARVSCSGPGGKFYTSSHTLFIIARTLRIPRFPFVPRRRSALFRQDAPATRHMLGSAAGTRETSGDPGCHDSGARQTRFLGRAHRRKK